MRKHGGWFEAGQPRLTAWFAKEQAKRHKRNKAAKKSRKRNRKG